MRIEGQLGLRFFRADKADRGGDDGGGLFGAGVEQFEQVEQRGRGVADDDDGAGEPVALPDLASPCIAPVELPELVPAFAPTFISVPTLVPEPAFAPTVTVPPTSSDTDAASLAKARAASTSQAFSCVVVPVVMLARAVSISRTAL